MHHLRLPPKHIPESSSSILLIRPTLQYSTLQWSVPSQPREFDNRLYYPVSLLLHTQSGTVEVDDEFTYMGDGRFWCGGIIVGFSSRRQVTGDVYMIKASLREELAWLEYIEGDIEQVGKWISMGEERQRKVRLGKLDSGGMKVRRVLGENYVLRCLFEIPRNDSVIRLLLHWVFSVVFLA